MKKTVEGIVRQAFANVNDVNALQNAMSLSVNHFMSDPGIAKEMKYDLLMQAIAGLIHQAHWFIEDEAFMRTQIDEIIYRTNQYLQARHKLVNMPRLVS